METTLQRLIRQLNELPASRPSPLKKKTRLVNSDRSELLVKLRDALVVLETQDAELHRLCQLHYFVDLTLSETAITMGLSTAEVTRRLRLANAWLFAHLNKEHRNGR